MNASRTLLATAAATLGAVTAQIDSAHAERKMLVLFDASGSMTTSRSSDDWERFEAAQNQALADIRNRENLGGTVDGIAIYSFRGSEMFSHTSSFVDANCAKWLICHLTGKQIPSTPEADGDVDNECVDFYAIPSIPGCELVEEAEVTGLTPLAGSMCDAADILRNEPASEHILYTASDGEENFTPDTHQCYGESSDDPDPPYDPGSWQRAVRDHILDEDLGVITADTTLYDDVSNGSPSALATHGDQVFTASSTDGGPELADFFGELAQATGGVFRHIPDDQPQPVFGDVNGDFCVDALDAQLVLENFGQTVPPGDATFDLDRDGFIGLEDYLVVVNEIDGTCGEGFPYEEMEPLTCRRDTLEIEGAAIATAGNAIEVQGACDITIRDSIIVAGESVIASRGGVQVTIENSFVAGEDALITARGGAWISAANTLLRGLESVRGSFRFDDQGGNDWQ